jgi:hypothetical protein
MAAIIPDNPYRPCEYCGHDLRKCVSRKNYAALRTENAKLKAKLGDEDLAYRELRDGYDNQQQRIAELEAALNKALSCGQPCAGWDNKRGWKEAKAALEEE